jgi:hypothetical protein
VRPLILVFVCALAALAANIKLYLKDGGYQLVREYEVKEDRVRYYSVERSDWEEIPLELVDLNRTKSEVQEREQKQSEEAKALADEDKAEREARREVERVPLDTGVYWVSAEGAVKALPQAESKVVSNKRRSVLKVMAPIPIVSGKANVELDGEQSNNIVASDRPEFYFRLAAVERFGIAKLTRQKGTRLIAKLTIIPVTKEIVEEIDQVEVFRRQVDDGLYKIWPTKPLEPGEYMVYEYTEGKANFQVWDFSYRPAGK